VRPKESPDSAAYLPDNAIKFKDSYIKMVETKFSSMYATYENHQRRLYNSCDRNDGIVDAYEANLEIRAQLASEAMEIINSFSAELSGYLWNIIDQIINWISKRMYNINEEIRDAIIGKDQILQEFLIKKGFDSLIQHLARPATDILLRNPRSKNIRIKILLQYPLALLVLNNFFEKGSFKKHGIIQFLANGTLDEKIDADISFCQNVLLSKQEVNSSSELMQKKENPYEKLAFSPDAPKINDVLKEIKEDLEEFKSCMKNSVFFGSGILEYYNQELDNIKRRFIEIEENERAWQNLVIIFKFTEILGLLHIISALRF
jgi:hypothetical protein